MKVKSFIISALALLFGFAPQASAEELTHSYPYGFVGVQGGAQMVTNGYARRWSFGDVLTPTVSAYGGAHWTPVLATRLHANFWKGREGYNEVGAYYGFNYVTLTADLMVNMVSLFNHRDDNVCNLYLIGGFGGNKSWGDEWRELTTINTTGQTVNAYQENLRLSKYQTSAMPVPEGHMAPEQNRITHSEKLGLMLDFKLSPRVSFNIEADAVHHGNHDYVPEVNMSKDWQVTTQLGFTFRFGKVRRSAPVPVVPAPVEKPAPVAPAPVEEPAPAPVEEKAEVVTPAKQLEAKKVVVFYACAVTDGDDAELTKVREMAAWLQSHPTAVATVKGYADKGTGNARINVRYARERAEKIAAALKAQGIAAGRLTVSSYGDTVQPFAENDQNRCVIVEAEEK